MARSKADAPAEALRISSLSCLAGFSATHVGNEDLSSGASRCITSPSMSAHLSAESMRACTHKQTKLYRPSAYVMSSPSGTTRIEAGQHIPEDSHISGCFVVRRPKRSVEPMKPSEEPLYRQAPLRKPCTLKEIQFPNQLRKLNALRRVVLTRRRRIHRKAQRGTRNR